MTSHWEFSLVCHVSFITRSCPKIVPHDIRRQSRTKLATVRQRNSWNFSTTGIFICCCSTVRFDEMQLIILWKWSHEFRSKFCQFLRPQALDKLLRNHKSHSIHCKSPAKTIENQNGEKHKRSIIYKCSPTSTRLQLKIDFEVMERLVLWEKLW